MPSTLSPSLPFQQIFAKYYALAENDRDEFNALIQPRHTTKASILLHAVSENAVTYTDYLNHTFSILVKYNCLLKYYNKEGALAIVMCIDEGSTNAFKRELARIYKDNVKSAPELEIHSIDVHFSDVSANYGEHYETYNRDPFGKDTHALLRLLKTRGSMEMIVVHCGLRKTGDSLTAKGAGFMRSGET